MTVKLLSTSVLGRLGKIAKTDYQLHVCPSVRMGQLGYHWTDFHQI
jgi:hypothetical protein